MAGEDVKIVPCVIGAPSHRVDELAPMGGFNELDSAEDFLETGEVYNIELVVTNGSLDGMKQDVMQNNARVAT